MPDYKNGKWAAQLIELQKDDGSWGDFHTLAMPTSGKAIATEQAINRLGRLGFTKDDPPIQKALAYMHGCLADTSKIPDYREKRLDWDIFVELMLAVWIRRFTCDDSLANSIAEKWRVITDAAFQTGRYDPDAYINTFYEVMKPKYGAVKRHKEVLRPNYYYPVSVLAGEIGENIEKAYFDYVIDSKTGYYYTYQGALAQPPRDFHSKEASRYLAAVELYCEYPNRYCKDKLRFVVDWLNANKNTNGKWDMGAAVKDGTCFPLSDSWRTAELRERDCTYRIENIIRALE
jgi:hypothetical protein